MPDIWMDVDTALPEVPVNVMPLLDDTDFKTREESVVYNQAGLDLVWNFTTTAGAFTQTAVTPTETAGDYDWNNQGNGMYAIEIPASGGASINNDTEGFGWFTGFATGILPWRGPVIGFRAVGLNNALIDSAYSATRGLAGTALPDAAADAAGGLPISDAGGLDLDAQVGTDIDAILLDTSTTIDDLVDDLESRLGTPSDLGSGATVAANLVDIEGQSAPSVSDILTTQMTESYNADGSAPTVAQALMGILQRLTEFSISGTTITVKKLDGTTTAMTLTMDDSIDPASSTRSG